jgi:hypothetical protein
MRHGAPTLTSPFWVIVFHRVLFPAFPTAAVSRKRSPDFLTLRKISTRGIRLAHQEGVTCCIQRTSIEMVNPA